MKNLILFTILFIPVFQSIAQKSTEPRYLGSPIWTDSLSTIFFPTHYNEDLLSHNKIALLDSYYANLVVYDFKSDTYKRLFRSDTFIQAFGSTSYSGARPGNRSQWITSKWVFFLVKNSDTDGNGRIDGNDPSIFYATTVKGENLQALTEATENVVWFGIYEDQGFGLLRIQRDSNNDHEFKFSDRNFYYKKFDLNDLSVGRPIELR